ncbi:MAG TPA: NAD(P)H-hydrate epimerase [Candidatus Nitrosopolaris sp.]|nr:NAD(P)H-hydrate epimerase [Candidatus Nitrosopolaris sp.]
MILRRTMTITHQNEAISSTQMYQIEEKAHSRFGMRRIYMMENAGHGMADFVNANFKTRSSRITRLVAVCGTGNNGGDVFVAARHLSRYPGYAIAVILLGRPRDLRTEEARTNWEILKKMHSIETSICNQVDVKARTKISKANVILDGIFGTGIRGDIHEPQASAIELINKSDAWVVAADIPSGLDPDTGKSCQKCILADATVTFHRRKTGLLIDRKHSGRVYVEHIGIPMEAERGILR